MISKTLDPPERISWLRLTRTPTIGPVTFYNLLARFKSVQKSLEAIPSLTRGKSISIPSIEEATRELEALEKLGGQCLASCEPTYPKYLKAVTPPPPMIRVLGSHKNLLDRPCVAIVGSRNASANGLQFARDIATELGAQGYIIVSGLARGIDTAAHHGALMSGTVAVLGGGVDHIYPRQNTNLYHDIKDQGLLISENPLAYRATARDFPRRNRIISGLSMGVVIIEAAERSGTLITARHALEQNREVMAAPGSPLDPRTKGCNRLIKQGAALIENADDVISILSHMTQTTMEETPSSYQAQTVQPDENQSHAPHSDFDPISDQARNQVKSLLSPTPVHRDYILRMSSLSPSQTMAILLELELIGELFVEVDGKISINPSFIS